MQLRATSIAILVLLLVAACGGDEDDATEVAVRNLGTASIDATVAEGTDQLEFKGVAAGTTSTFQTVNFGSLSGVKVSVGSANSTVALTEAKRNVVEIGADGKVTTVSVPVTAGGSEGGW